MNILTVDYSMATKSMDIFFSGCRMGKHCPGCHNSEAWDFSVGKDWRTWVDKITKDTTMFGGMFDKFFILGGEPLDQDLSELSIFLNYLRNLGKEIWLFTRYELEEIPPDMKCKFEYIKTGPYREELSVKDYVCEGVTLATSNQKIWKYGRDY